MLTKGALSAAGLRPGELAKIIDKVPNTVSRYTSEGSERIEPPAAVVALVYAWPHLPDAVRADLLAGKHMATS